MATDARRSPVCSPAFGKDAKALQFIEKMTSNADDVQGEVLAEILRRNADTEYLKLYNLAGATDRETFKSKIPMVTYEDLQPLIQRIANGDRSPILSAHPISEFLTSSGTSAGERKLMPTIREDMDRRQLLYSLLMPVMNHVYKNMLLQPILQEASLNPLYELKWPSLNQTEYINKDSNTFSSKDPM